MQICTHVYVCKYINSDISNMADMWLAIATWSKLLLCHFNIPVSFSMTLVMMTSVTKTMMSYGNDTILVGLGQKLQISYMKYYKIANRFVFV